jgi:hypothetical protein
MHYERFGGDAVRPPLCSRCAQIMGLARITWRFDDLPELYIFECRLCGVSHIEAAFHDFSPREHGSPAIGN